MHPCRGLLGACFVSHQEYVQWCFTFLLASLRLEASGSSAATTSTVLPTQDSSSLLPVALCPESPVQARSPGS